MGILAVILSLSSAAFAAQVFADDAGTMTVPLQMISTAPGSYQPGITISVAGGPPTQVLLDTGSVGLHIFANQVGTQGIMITKTKVMNGYGDGEMYEGVIAYAPVTIGGQTTAAIPIVLVQKDYCIKSKPDCPVAHNDPNNPKPDGGLYGTMGVSMQTESTKGASKDTLYSPTRALPGNYGSGFILKDLSTGGGSLVLGLTPSNTSGFNKVQLSAMGKYPDGSTVYNDKGLSVHYKIGKLSRDFQTAFDTGGNSAIHFFSGTDLGLPVSKNKVVKPGLPFSANLPNGFNWSFTTGKEEGVNLVSIKPALAGKPTYINTGITFFFDYDVMYGYKDGMLGFSPH